MTRFVRRRYLSIKPKESCQSAKTRFFLLPPNFPQEIFCPALAKIAHPRFFMMLPGIDEAMKQFNFIDTQMNQALEVTLTF